MKRFLILAAWLMPLCAFALGKEEAMLKQYFTRPVAPVSQSAPKSGPKIRAVYPTFFFVKEDARLLQLVRVELSGNAGSRLIIRAVRPGGWSYDNPINGAEAVIKVLDLREKAGLELKLLEGGKEIQSLNFDWTPAKQWKVYLSFVSHLDLGYTNTTENVFKKRNDITEMALSDMDQSDNWPDDAKFRWTMEGAWELKYFLEQHPDRLDQIRKRAQEGRLEVCAKLVHEHTETEGYEELFRDVYYSQIVVGPLLGVESKTFMLNDVDGITQGEVSALASSGVKYFSFNPNSFYRGGNILHATKMPQAFYWQGPDQGELLTWRSKDAYTEAPYLYSGYDQTLEGMTGLLKGYEQNNYGYDAIHITRSGADKSGANDNSWPRIDACEVIKEWDSHFAYPRLISSTPTKFFQYLEANFQDQIPKVKGDLPDWWADGVITEAKWTAISRGLHHLLYQTEAVAGIASLLDPSYQYPKKEISDAYYNNILFDEHTWGYLLNTAPQHQEIFGIKSGWLSKSGEEADKLLKDAFSVLARQIAGPEPTVIVFNPLPWPAAYYAAEKGSSTMKMEGLSPGVYSDIPAFGYKSFKIPAPGNEPTPEANLQAGNGILENQRYQLTFDGKKGVTSIYDKKLRRELVDQNAKYHLGEFISRKQDLADLTDIRTSLKIISSSNEKNNHAASATFTISAPIKQGAEKTITQTFTIYDGSDYIDLENRIPYDNHSRESLYLAFPFNIPDFEIWVETPYGKMRPYYDQLPDYAKFYAVSHSIELKSKSDNFSIVWSTKEAPMVELGEITKKAGFTSQMFWPFFYRAGIYPWNPNQPTVYSELMNNFQNTNFSPSQKGEMTFHYRIIALDSKDADQAHRSGWELSTPAMAVVSEGGSGELPPMGSFATVSPDNVMITEFKMAEDGDGYIVRLYEASGKPATARLEFPLFKLSGAWLADGVERVQSPMEIKNGIVTIDLAPFEVKTIRVKLNAR